MNALGLLQEAEEGEEVAEEYARLLLGPILTLDSPFPAEPG